MIPDTNLEKLRAECERAIRFDNSPQPIGLSRESRDHAFTHSPRASRALLLSVETLTRIATPRRGTPDEHLNVEELGELASEALRTIAAEFAR